MTTRPLVAVTLVYIAGIIAARFLAEDLFLVYVILSVFVVAGAAAYLWRVVSFPLFMAAVLVVVFITGAAAFRLSATPPDGALTEYAGQKVIVEGTVVEEPRRDEGYTTYILLAETVETRQGRQGVEGQLLARIYHGKDGDVYWYGDRLRLEGEIVEPKGRRNPGGFDYSFYLRTQGVDALMYLQPRQATSPGEGQVSRLASSAFILRSRMIEGIKRNLPSPQAELLAAVLFGQRHLLPDDVQENFIRSGTNHLMAVSGLHVGLVAALILGLLRFLRLKGPAAIILAVLLIFAYAYITGMRPAALRAALMLSLGLVAILAGRQRDFSSALSLAALVTLVYNPLILFTVGFQLSYAATLSIFYLYPFLLRETFYRLPSYIGKLISVTLAAQAGVLPLTTYYFQQLPVAALIFNILLLPLMALVVALGLTGGLVYLLWPALSAVLHLANLPLLSYIVVVSRLAEVPWVYLDTAPPGIPLLIAYYTCMALGLAAYYRHLSITAGAAEPGDNNGPTLDSAVLKKYVAGLTAFVRQTLAKQQRSRLIIAALILLTIIVWAGAFVSPQAGLTVYYIDVGQGAAAYMETACGFRMLVDAGGEPPYVDPDKQGQIGEKVIVPFLRHMGVKRLDLAVITHPHEDHFGGFHAVLDNIPVDHMIISPVPGETDLYGEMLEKALEKGVESGQVYEGEHYNLCCCLSMEILLPPPELYRGTSSDLNNNSVVFRLAHGEVDFLFTGDIEEEAVRDLLRSGTDISAQVLLVPHHGGNFDSVAPFLEAVSPVVAVIQVGRNPFGHPHPNIINALEGAGITFFRNDIHGAVIIRTDGSSLWQKTMLEAS